ncbi:uncharacterized protein LOC129748585 [Uranotaenia lowii]|uniref:uncharacterized protein LOC129748585 n=1 Tax=Uranotaenia lowii TaxID=190385 RepID=UPI002479B655|nr:uncharacterized protein LOC129748585 [Uranotaenia lowii]
MKFGYFLVLCGFLVVATTGQSGQTPAQSSLAVSITNLGRALGDLTTTVKANLTTIKKLAGSKTVTALKNLNTELKNFGTTLSKNAVDLRTALSRTVTSNQVAISLNGLTSTLNKLNADLKAADKGLSSQELINGLANFYKKATPTVNKILALLQTTPGTAAYNVLRGVTALIVDVNTLGNAVLGLAG